MHLRMEVNNNLVLQWPGMQEKHKATHWRWVMELETLQCPGCWQKTLTLVPPDLYNTVMYCSNTICGAVAMVYDQDGAEDGLNPREVLATALALDSHKLQYYEQQGFDVMDLQSQGEVLERSPCTLIVAKKYPMVITEAGETLVSPPPNRPLDIAYEQFEAELERLWAEALRLLEEMGEEIFPNTVAGWAKAAITHFNFSRLMQRAAQIRFAQLVDDLKSGKRQLPDMAPEDWPDDE